MDRHYLVPHYHHRRSSQTSLSLGSSSHAFIHSLEMSSGRSGDGFAGGEIPGETHESLREKAQVLDRSGSHVSSRACFCKIFHIQHTLVWYFSILFSPYSEKSFNEESLIDEPWESGAITIKEDKASCPMLSVHLCGGQFKRKWVVRALARLRRRVAIMLQRKC